MSMETTGVKFGTYTVQQGDTLSSIVKNAGGDVNISTFDEIAEQSNISDINKIYVGQEIYLDSSSLEGQILDYINGFSETDDEISDLNNLSFLNENDDYDLSEFTTALMELKDEYGENEQFSDELEVLNGVLNQIQTKGLSDIRNNAEINGDEAGVSNATSELNKGYTNDYLNAKASADISQEWYANTGDSQFKGQVEAAQKDMAEALNNIEFPEISLKEASLNYDHVQQTHDQSLINKHEAIYNYAKAQDELSKFKESGNQDTGKLYAAEKALEESKIALVESGYFGK